MAGRRNNGLGGCSALRLSTYNRANIKMACSRGGGVRSRGCRFPLHLGRLELWMGHQQMPENGLERFGMRGDRRGVDYGDEHAGVGNTGREPAVAAHDSTNLWRRFASHTAKRKRDWR